MREETRKAEELLASRNHSLVVINGDEVITSDKNGVRPILEFLQNNPDKLYGASVADKVIGSAAALLLVKGGVGEVYAAVMSEKATGVLNNYSVPFSYGTLVPYVINRKGDDMCPMEKLCLNITDPEEAHKKITEFVSH